MELFYPATKIRSVVTWNHRSFRIISQNVQKDRVLETGGENHCLVPKPMNPEKYLESLKVVYKASCFLLLPFNIGPEVHLNLTLIP